MYILQSLIYFAYIYNKYLQTLLNETGIEAVPSCIFGKWAVSTKRFLAWLQEARSFYMDA